MFVILINVLHTIGSALDVDGLLLFTVTAELPAKEDDEGGEVPQVAQERHSQLDREVNISVSVQTEDYGHDEERCDDGKHPHSGPELSFFFSELLSQAETNQGDDSHSAVGKSLSISTELEIVQGIKRYSYTGKIKQLRIIVLPAPGPQPIYDTAESRQKVEDVTPNLRHGEALTIGRLHVFAGHFQSGSRWFD